MNILRFFCHRPRKEIEFLKHSYKCLARWEPKWDAAWITAENEALELIEKEGFKNEEGNRYIS